MSITVASQNDFPDFPETRLKTTFDRRVVLDLSNHLSKKRSHENKVLYQVGTSYSCPRGLLLNADMANDSLRRFYLSLCEYLAGSSRINRPWFRLIQPELHSFIDIPGSKHKNDPNPRTHFGNSPFHHHSILIADARHEVRLDALLAKEPREALRQDWAKWCHLMAMDFQKVGSTDGDIVKVVDYASHYARKRLRSRDGDQMYVAFPKSDFEFRKRLNRKENENDAYRSNGGSHIAAPH